MITVFRVRPTIDKSVFTAPSADIIGRVTIGADSSIWFGAIIRGDVNNIVIGERVSIQDGAVVHVTHESATDAGFACVIGSDTTVGHRAVLHGCTIEEACLIGMGAVVLDGAVIGKESIVGAGAVVTGGKKFPPRSLILGSPAKVVRTLNHAEITELYTHAARYVELKNEYLKAVAR